MNTVKLNKARLEAKVNIEIYELLKQAAAITGRTLTDFVVSVAYEEAKKKISEHNTLKLSMRDQQLFVDSLDKNIALNASMQEALSIYKKFNNRNQHDG